MIDDSDEIPTFRVDLDLPPEHRWTEVCDTYRDTVRRLLHDLESLLGDFLQHRPVRFVLRILAAWSLWWMPAEYAAEITAVANDLEIERYKAILAHLVYEVASAQTAVELHTMVNNTQTRDEAAALLGRRSRNRGPGCTALVLHDDNGTPVLARNLDWALPALDELVIHVEFVRGGAPVFVATTFAGYVGVLTGMNTATLPGAPGVGLAVNFRVQPASIFVSAARVLIRLAIGTTPICLALRRTLEREPEYADALAELRTKPLAAPAFLSVIGTAPGEGAIVTRGFGSACDDTVMLAGPGDVLSISNLDQACTCPVSDWMMGDSILRRELARRMVRDGAELRTVLSTYPIANEVTLHSNVMSVAQGSYDFSRSAWLGIDPLAGNLTRCVHGMQDGRRCRRKAARADWLGVTFYCAQHAPVDFAALARDVEGQVHEAQR